jgi:hypothetical protein
MGNIVPSPPAAFTPATEEFMQGATLRPQYIQRTPPMWAVMETDMEALSTASIVSTVAFAIGSFCLGVAANIIVDYGGASTLTEMGSFMLHKCTWISSIAGTAFFFIGGYFHHRKGSLWKRIKSETKIMLPPQ